MLCQCSAMVQNMPCHTPGFPSSEKESVMYLGGGLLLGLGFISSG